MKSNIKKTDENYGGPNTDGYQAFIEQGENATNPYIDEGPGGEYESWVSDHGRAKNDWEESEQEGMSWEAFARLHGVGQ